MLNNDLFRSWAIRQWEKEAIKRTPLAKSIRSAKAQDRALKLEYKKRLRSLTAQNGAKMRSLKMKQAADAQALREKQTVMDAERKRREWDLLLGQGRPGV